MKKIVVLAAILMLAGTSCQTRTEENKLSTEENTKISNLYHQRNLEDVDSFLADDFVGSYYFNNKLYTWTREDHKNAIRNNPGIKDSILTQVAEKDWVATRFIRSATVQDSVIKAEVMQFMQLRDGKIIRSYELFTPLEVTNEADTTSLK